MSGHTPTPGDWWTQIYPDGDGIRWEVMADGPRRICVLSRRDESGANARLIAAAPDLLAACEEMLAHEVYTYEGNLEARVTVPCDVIDQLRAAIAKARPE